MDDEPIQLNLAPDSPDYIGRHLDVLRRFAAHNPEEAGLLINALVGGMVQASARAFVRHLTVPASAQGAPAQGQAVAAQAAAAQAAAQAAAAQAAAGLPEGTRPSSNPPRTEEARWPSAQPDRPRAASTPPRSVDSFQPGAGETTRVQMVSVENQRPAVSAPPRPMEVFQPLANESVRRTETSRPPPSAEVHHPSPLDSLGASSAGTGAASYPPQGAPAPPALEVGDRVHHRWLGEGVVERVWWRDDHWHVATDRFGAPASRLKRLD